ncbi:MAG: hypothetical protein ACI9TH_004695 [Kiritimatiellia bacterium]|jgi:hypothetical protein
MTQASDSLTCTRMIGQLPPSWNRSVIFFANLKSLFFGNQAERDFLLSEVRGVSTYGGRLIPLLNLLYHSEHNLLVLEEAPDPVLLQYFTQDLKLSIPEVRILPFDPYRQMQETDPCFQDLADHAADWVEGFVTDSYLGELTRRLGKQGTTSSEGSYQGNNKLLLHQHLEQQGLPTFDTFLAHSASEAVHALAGLRDQGYAGAVVKSPIGASGIGLFKLAADPAAAGTIPDYLFHEDACMVQGWLGDDLPGVSDIRSPSVQLFVHEDHLSLYDLTEQLLSPDSLHEGNVAPPPYLASHAGLQEELLRQAEVAGRWLHRTTYRGTASVDFLLAQRNGKTEVRICEINARVTGATYPSMLARHFAPGEAWLMRNLRAHEPVPGEAILDALDTAGLLYHPRRIRGVLPINFNLNPEGQVFKGQFLCIAPDPEDCAELLREADELYTTEWSNTHD